MVREYRDGVGCERRRVDRDLGLFRFELYSRLVLSTSIGGRNTGLG